ncbi:MAG: metal-dependent hydrolase [Alphaproteobacteria bacterium]|nr:MAG: metal-dependent hydrolase [Alphaproteobacteria bacterium]
MATVFSHIAIPIGMYMALGGTKVPKSLMEAGALATVMADIDCLAFNFGIPYESQWGHRGFTHSIVMALAIGGLWAWRQKEELVKPWDVFFFTFICAMSHPILDAMTDGGLGIAFFWPFSTERYFLPVNPIPVSPIGPGFASLRGVQVFLTEIILIWIPCLFVGGTGFAIRKLLDKKKNRKT